MKTPALQYFAVTMPASVPSVCMPSPDDLFRFINLHAIKEVFISGNADEQYFGVFYQQVFLCCLALGYQKLEDYQQAKAANFPAASEFYAALAQGYIKYEDYQLATVAGITDRALFNLIAEGGFIEGFQDFNTIIAASPGQSYPQLPAFSNPYQLYLFATENGFKLYNAFRSAYTRGFINAGDLEAAESRGFAYRADYEEGLAKGFEQFTDLELARLIKARDRTDLSKWIDLNFSGTPDCSFDKKLLLSLVSKIEQGKKISINKLKDLLNRSIEEYRYADNGEMPAWLSISLASADQWIAFLRENDNMRQYGSYDADGEFFETHRYKDRSIVIDGSNVAHNGKPVPLVSNILKMVEYLKQNGFADIHVINDASLRHKVTDTENLQTLKEITKCSTAPVENPADIFIIQYVKKHHCLLVSNDTFREWKVQDPWVATNIDYYRLTFMIKEDTVLMPDLK